ncbi:MAG: hypothetical protein AAGA48_40525 [Myxococcota bacterium]
MAVGWRNREEGVWLQTNDEVVLLPTRTLRSRIGYAVQYVLLREHGGLPEASNDLTFLVKSLSRQLKVPPREFRRYLGGRRSDIGPTARR